MSEHRMGVVKWFDTTKGFGFVTDGSGGRDILLHANVLRNFGHSSIMEGAQVEVTVTETPRGLQATDILSIGTPEPQAEGLAHVEGIDTAALADAEPLQPARVKWFDKVKGFGFVNTFGGTDDIFVHMEVLRAYGMAELVQGEAVCVRVAQGPRGRMAAEIRAWDHAVGRAGGDSDSDDSDG